MVKNMILILGIMLLLLVNSNAQEDSQQLSENEVKELYEALKNDSIFYQMVKRFGDPIELYKDFKAKVRKSDSIWLKDQKELGRLDNIGTTAHFEMLPLIDWFTKDDELIGEAGVSYLIKTDEAIILFDVGLNHQNKDPSPLLSNMNELGINIDDIDMIVISHNHLDHVGGNQWSAKNTFSLTNHQIDLGQKTVYTPIPMTYPGLDPICTPKPVKIAKGVATTGVIPGPMFFSDIGEQALVFNVKDKGIIVVSGCGHQTIEKLVLRTQLLFDEPIYGVLGGFHLPLSEERLSRVYKYFVTGKLPWQSLTMKDIEYNIDLLNRHGVKLVGISGHDSCDTSIEAFRKAFKSSYVDIVVGEKIIVD